MEVEGLGGREEGEGVERSLMKVIGLSNLVKGLVLDNIILSIRSAESGRVWYKVKMGS